MGNKEQIQIIMIYGTNEIPEQFIDYYNILTKCQYKETKKSRYHEEKFSFAASYLLDLDIKFYSIDDIELRNIVFDENQNRNIFFMLYYNKDMYLKQIEHRSGENEIEKIINAIHGKYAEQLFVLVEEGYSIETAKIKTNYNIYYHEKMGQPYVAMIPFLRLFNIFLDKKMCETENAVDAKEEEKRIKIFISYRQKIDARIRCNVIDVLSKYKLDTFLDIKDASGNVQEAIEENIIKSDAMLVLYSDDYATSPWCVNEIEIARKNGLVISMLDLVTIMNTRLLQQTSNLKSIRYNSELRRKSGIACVVKKTIYTDGKRSFKIKYQQSEKEFMGDENAIILVLVQLLFQLMVKKYMNLKYPKNSGSRAQKIHPIHFQPAVVDTVLLDVFASDQDKRTTEIIVYPEPIMQKSEIDLLKKALESQYKEKYQILTEVEYDSQSWGAFNKDSQMEERRKIIQISSSEPNSFSAEHVSSDHFADFLHQLLRYSYHHKHSIAYAGSFSTEYQPNISQIILDFASLYKFEEERAIGLQKKEKFPLFYCFNEVVQKSNGDILRRINERLSTRVGLFSLEKDEQTEWLNSVTKLEDKKLIKSPDKTELLTAQKYNIMRHCFAKNSDVLIAIGGKIKNNMYSGILYEILLYINEGKPIYIIPDFGGAASIFANFLLRAQDELNNNKKISELFLKTELHDILCAGKNFSSETVSPEILVADLYAQFKEIKCVTGILKNGLDWESNKKILEREISRMQKIILIMKGMSNLIGHKNNNNDYNGKQKYRKKTYKALKRLKRKVGKKNVEKRV